ncbi:MAG: class I SAM-dependent methyltransferase, partial [Jatrophihabitantaceae bacterium]
RTSCASTTRMRAGLAPGGRLVEGTCDEIGRHAGWALLDADGPRTLTLACRVESIERPSELAERLPKALIHHNVPGQPIHALLADFDAAWAAAAPLSSFGPRQRWIAACTTLATQRPVRTARARHGELTVDWPAVAPS